MNAQNLILFVIIIAIRCDKDLKIKIGLPEYICDKDGDVKDISSDITTIRIVEKDVQSVSYKFDVNFHTTGKKCAKNQRCTLMKWKAIRELDQYLNSYPQSKLERGLIEINNSMFLPGIQYLINITVINNNKVVEEKRLSLDYADDSTRDKIAKPTASLWLLAPNTSYAYATYFINAEVNICSNISSYYFNWEVKDSSENSSVFPTKSSELVVPPDTFKALETYAIKCNLIRAVDGSAVAASERNVNILSKGLLLRLPVKKFTTRTGQDVRIKAYIRDLDNLDEKMKISWSCLEITTNEECDYNSDEGELDVSSTFSRSGTYYISVEISKSQFTETDSCIVEVLDETPIIEIEEIEFPVNPTRGAEIQATIYDLRSFCTIEWTSPEEENYEALDLAKVPGNVDEIVNITKKEDLFLIELEEFSNGTTNRKHNLIIPPPNDNWGGLKGDAKYLFRLILTCPSAVEIFNDLNDTAESVKITTTADVILETNAPPVTHNLEVAPTAGEAFITSFNFKTQKAQDKLGDDPILYKFGYRLDSRDIIVWNLAETTSCQATLPYSEDGIQTFVEACDNFGSCSRAVGPLIKTKLPEDINKEGILQRFVSKLEREDYPQAFTEAFIILWSFKAEQDNTIREFINQRVAEEIDKYLKMRDDFTLRHYGNDLIKSINDFNPQLELPASILDKVVELRNKLSNEPVKYIQRKLLEIREPRASSLNLGDVKNYLEVSELIITTSNDPNKVHLEKENLRKQLRHYMEKLCSNMKKTQLSLELKTVIFSVEKLKRNALNNFLSVPFEGNSWQTFGRIKLGNVVKDSKDKCVGKAIFRDYLEKIGVLYFADILNTNNINESPDIVIFLPKNKSFSGTPKCLVYYDDGWHSECKMVQNIAGYVKCNCKHLGYYYLDYTEFVNTTPSRPTATKNIETTPTSLSEKNFTTRNESLERLQNDADGKYDTISYVVIGVSVIGIIILAITVRKIFTDEDDNEESDTFDFPKYAQLHDEEFLTDVHI